MPPYSTAVTAGEREGEAVAVFVLASPANKYTATVASKATTITIIIIFFLKALFCSSLNLFKFCLFLFFFIKTLPNLSLRTKTYF